MSDSIPTVPEERLWDATHPWYDERKQVWKYNLDHLKGGRKLVENRAEYLPQFRAESDAGYDSRAQRAAGLYNHLVKRAIAVYQAQIFREEPDRQLPPALMEMVEDVDRFRTKASAFFKKVYRRAQVTGQEYILIDSPRVTPGLSQADVQLQKLRPYFEHVVAENVIDWSIETRDPARVGVLNHIVIRDSRDERRPFSQPITVTRYRLWTRDTWQIFEKQGEKAVPQLILEGTHTLGEVPVVVLYDIATEKAMQGESISDDVSLSANSLWNAASVADESFYWQGFNQLVVVTQSETLAELKLGTSNAIKLAPGEQAYYLTPSTVPIDIYEKRVAETVERVTDLVFNRTSRQQPTGQVESAEKKRADREEFIALLESKSADLETAEKRCWEFAARWLKMTPEAARAAVKVSYPKEFDVGDSSIEDWQKLTEEGIRSRVDWIKSENPDLDDAAAIKKIEENLALEERLRPVRMDLTPPELPADGEVTPPDPNVEGPTPPTPPTVN